MIFNMPNIVLKLVNLVHETTETDYQAALIFELQKGAVSYIEKLRNKDIGAELKLVGKEIDGTTKYNTELTTVDPLVWSPTGIARWDIPSPLLREKTLIGIPTSTGISITVNDTQGMDVYLKRFMWNPDARVFSADFEFEIFDHYGLDQCDIDEACGKSFFDKPGFLSWFMLQRYYGYKPFITIIKFDKSLERISY
jgi:hypothetical protein